MADKDYTRGSDVILYQLVEDVGALKAQVSEGHKQRSGMVSLLGEIKTSVDKMSNVSERVRSLEEEVSGFKRLKYLLMGGGAVIGAGGASVGWASLIKLLKSPFDGLGGH